MKLYSYHHYYVMRTVIALLLLPVYIGLAYLVYSHTGEGKTFLVTLVACVALSALIMVIKENCRQCPDCKCHTLSTQTEPAFIASFHMVTSRVVAVCRNCGYRRATDLAFKSNVMFKKIPVKIKD